MTGAALTAHPMAELPGSRPSKAREVIHAVCDDDAKIGWATRPGGGPLCGAFARLSVPEPGLFPAVVNCRPCLAVAAAGQIEIGGQL
jgi:hypothetical protein